MPEMNPALAFKGPSHVAISIPDLDAALAWYRDTLGFEVVRTWTTAETSGRAAYIERDAFRIELLWRKGSGAPPDVANEPRDPVADILAHGIKHVGFVVADVDAAIAALERRRVPIAIRPADNAEAGVRFAFFYDLAGNVLELTGPLKAEDNKEATAEEGR